MMFADFGSKFTQVITADVKMTKRGNREKDRYRRFIQCFVKTPASRLQRVACGHREFYTRFSNREP